MQSHHTTQEPAATARARTLAGALRACERALDLETSHGLDGLREPLRLLAVCARRANLPPEAMLIQLKRVLADSAQALQLSPVRADEVRVRTVALAIEAYFSTDGKG
jgi:hypothetical protein